MATKPTDVYTWSTDANFTSGPASGNPTKVNPAGWPTNLQGFVPGVAVVAEFANKLFNVSGQWITNWLLAGSSAGAADAHIVETNVSGYASVNGLEALLEAVFHGVITVDDDAIISPSALGADQNDWAPTGIDTATVVRLSASVGTVDITGIVAPGKAGQLLVLLNVGATNSVAIQPENAGSAAQNRILTPSGATATLNLHGAALLFYDGTSSRWRLMFVS